METIRPQDRGDHVRDVQRRLLELGFHVDATEIGEYGPSTGATVRGFQQERGLLVDGVVGPQTWRELVESCTSTTPRTAATTSALSSAG